MNSNADSKVDFIVDSTVGFTVESTVDLVVDSSLPRCPSEPVPSAAQYRVWALGKLW